MTSAAMVSLVLVMIAVSLPAVLPASMLPFTDNSERPGFSTACRSSRGIARMTHKAEVVVEAEVVEVSPPRASVYAVTLEVAIVLKDNFKPRTRKGKRLQLLFIKPNNLPTGQPELRSLPTAKSYLEACIYEMDLKVGKRYHLFLAGQPGKLTGKGSLARYVMTSPPLLASRRSRKKISAASCKKCVKRPEIKSVELLGPSEGKRFRLVCRVKRNKDTVISWQKDGLPVTALPGKINIKSKRMKSVLIVKRVRLSDSGVYSCVAQNQMGKDVKSSKITVLRRQDMAMTMGEGNTTERPNNASSPLAATTIAVSTAGSKATTAAPPTASTQRAVFPDERLPCPIEGYCLNGGTCSFIPWIGELSCSCAIGYQGARCDRKTTSALYSSLNVANTLCLFGIANPYTDC